jgi:hypothetical protein
VYGLEKRNSELEDELSRVNSTVFELNGKIASMSQVSVYF